MNANEQENTLQTLEEGTSSTVNDQQEKWRDSLATDEKGIVIKSASNLFIILSHDRDIVGCLGWNELSQQKEWLKSPLTLPEFRRGKPWAEENWVDVQLWAASKLYGTFGKEAIFDAVGRTSRENSFNPLKDYLSSLIWDGTSRLETWCENYLGAEKQAMPKGMWWMISAVARALEPGCQVDHMLILEGKQGAGKSTCCRILGGEWYSGNIGSLSNKDSFSSLDGKWIVEIAELDSLHKAESTKVKSFVSATSDHYRRAYAREETTSLRRCVFIGTTNESVYLSDPTGARRFWPVKIDKLNKAALERDKDQLWAEAVHLYKQGVKWFPTEKVQIDVLALETESKYKADPWEEFLATNLPKYRGETLTTSNILTDILQMPVDRQKMGDQKRIGEIMRRLGYSSARLWKEEHRLRVWTKDE